MAAIHPQLRLFRLAMVLAIFGLTVFLYAAYYTDSDLSMSSHLPIVSSSSSSSGGGGDEQPPAFYAKELIGGGSSGVRIRSAAAVAEDQRLVASVAQMEPENVNGSNAQLPLPEVAVQSAPSAAAAQQQQQQQQQQQTSGNPPGSKTPLAPEAQAAAAVGVGVALPSTQKTSANASASAASPSAAAAATQPLSQKSTNSQAVSAAVAAAAKPVAAVAVAPIVHGGNIDTLKGVRTAAIYEPGHSDACTSLCPDSGAALRLMILITSAPTHYDARLAIRQTWGSYATRRDIGIGFILGSTQSAAVEEALAAETAVYGDLVRGHFLDSYNNLTLKTISSLEWIDTYCSRVPFFLKTDDDMFINVPRLMAFMEKHTADRNVIYGRLAKKWKPIRNKKSKYYVSPQQYFPPVFPAFTTGPAYLMSTNVVHDLYAKALNQTYLKLEDVFTTGIVAQLVNVKRMHVNEFVNRRIAFNPCNIRRVISLHMVKSNEQFDLWKKLLDTGTKCK